MLVNNGVDIATVSGAMGHSCISTTSNLYCHMIGDAQAKVAAAVSNSLNFHKKKDGKNTA
jgi:site-specific recombinase XerD